jgi:Na+-driven multidrug efflux pump
LTTETSKSIRSYWHAFLADQEYFRQVVRFALPLTLQNTIMASLNMVSVVFVGQLGDAPVAAIGLANQIFFLLQLVLFGINSGSAMFTAQLWGRQDIPNIRRVLALALLLGCSAAFIFLGLTQLAPQAVLGIYSKDPQVVALGSEYLYIFGWSVYFVALLNAFYDIYQHEKNILVTLTASYYIFLTHIFYGLRFLQGLIFTRNLKSKLR